jgi:uncharacterized membrane protein YhaH (DUF805 family)
MDWVWFLFEFDGRINRAKMWLAMLVIACWTIFLAVLMLVIEQMFGSPVTSGRLDVTVNFGIGDIFRLVDPTVLRAALVRLREGKEASPAHLVLAFCHAIGTLLFTWVYLATAIKRLHDRDKSAWWAIPYFVVPGSCSQFADRLPDSYLMLTVLWAPLLLAIAGFIEIFCLRGTRWTNRFGPNPLPKVQTRPRSSNSTSAWNQTEAMEFVPHQASSIPAMHVKRGHD